LADAVSIEIPLSRDFLVGTWKTESFEFGLYTKILWTINSDGTEYYYYYVEDNLQIIKGIWQYSDGIVYENSSTGLSGKGLVKRVNNNEFKLTIIDNDIPAYRSMKRKYVRQ